MSEIIKTYNIDKNTEAMSRYKTLMRIIETNGDEYIESYDEIIVPETSDDYFHEVQTGEVNRLDLISFKYYGTPLLWWVIAEVSEIINPLKVPAGTILRIPSKQSLYGYKGVL